jgi:hypothetical protein
MTLRDKRFSAKLPKPNPSPPRPSPRRASHEPPHAEAAPDTRASAIDELLARVRPAAKPGQIARPEDVTAAVTFVATSLAEQIEVEPGKPKRVAGGVAASIRRKAQSAGDKLRLERQAREYIAGARGKTVAPWNQRVDTGEVEVTLNTRIKLDLSLMLRTFKQQIEAELKRPVSFGEILDTILRPWLREALIDLGVDPAKK